MLTKIRIFSGVAGFSSAGLVLWLQPMTMMWSLVLAGLVFLLVPAVIEKGFRNAMPEEEIKRDLRDRVDNPPS